AASSGDIYITDGYGQSWVHRYNPYGEYIDSFGGLGQGEGQLQYPHGIMIDSRRDGEYVLVSDRRNNRLQYFTLDGRFVRMVHGDLRRPCTTVQWRDRLYIPDLFALVSILDGHDRIVAHLGDWPGCWEMEGWPS